MIYNPHNYQQVALEHILQNQYSKLCSGPKTGLFLEMGLGKTVVCLTAADILLMAGEVERIIVIGPLRVAQSVWSQEAAKWDHLKHLKFSHILGTEKQRIEGIKRKADIYVINRENMQWLVAYLGGAWPYDMAIIDESSSFKNGSSKRFRALRGHLGNIKRMVILTGTPAANGLMDLWAQIYLLDQGERLFDTVTKYRTRYFHRIDFNSKYVPMGGADEMIFEKIQGLVISMKNKDLLDLPERIDIDVPVYFDHDLQKKYDLFERECVMEISPEAQITAFNSGALSTKLLQFSAGAIYDREHVVHEIHSLKLDALEEIIESAGGKPVLVYYNFRHSADRIMKRFEAKFIKDDRDVLTWNRGEIPIALLHVQSTYGLNIQKGSNIIAWFDQIWDLELYDQANARLHRQGQEADQVYIYKIIAPGTMDSDVIRAQKRKAKGQDALMEAVKARVEKYYHISKTG